MRAEPLTTTDGDAALDIHRLIDRTHNEMMNHALHRVAMVYGQLGYEACDALRMANEAIEPAWDAWNVLVEEIYKLSGLQKPV